MYTRADSVLCGLILELSHLCSCVKISVARLSLACDTIKHLSIDLNLFLDTIFGRDKSMITKLTYSKLLIFEKNANIN